MRKLSILLLLALSLNVLSAETPIPAAPTGWVTDAAGFMSAPAARALDERLSAYERASGRQVLVYIGKTTGGVPIEDWAVKAFKLWKVGKKGLDNGVVLFVMTDDRRERIEVGYGLEGQFTDFKAARILEESIKPRLLAGDHDGAVTGGAEGIVNVLDGKPLPGTAATTSNRPLAPPKAPLSFLEFVFYAFLAIVFLLILVTHPNFALYMLINILSSSRGGSFSGGGGGGGFSGGGGRSGGGGASGSW